jgi:hypothetical protein
MKRLPYVAASIHAVFATVVFGGAIYNPLRGGLLPLFVFAADYPASLVIERIAGLLQHAFNAPLLTDYVAYLVFGSAWFFFLGLVLRSILNKLHGTREV